MQYVLGIVIVALLAVGGWFFLNSTPVDDPSDVDLETEETLDEEDFLLDDDEWMEEDGMTDDVATEEEEDATEGSVVEIEVSGDNFEFSPNEIRVNQGDTVRVHFTSAGGTHDFVIDEYMVSTSMLNAGESETVEFVADEAGSFEYYCSVGTHREMGMTGTLIVE